MMFSVNADFSEIIIKLWIELEITLFSKLEQFKYIGLKETSQRCVAFAGSQLYKRKLTENLNDI